MPFFSIILPIYNAKMYVGKTIRSIIEQKFQDYELIIINDGATDGSNEIAENISKSNPNVRYFSKDNGGICQTRNYGLERARGEYILFCDHDDIMIDGLLEKTYAYLAKSDIDVLKFSYRTFVVHDGNITKEYTNHCDNVLEPRESALLKTDYKQFNNFINVVWNGVYKREFLKKNMLSFNENIKFGQEDVMFNLQVLEKKCSFAMLSDVLYFHYIRYGQSTSRKFNVNKLYAIVESLRSETQYFGNNICDELAVEISNKYIRSFFVSIGIKKDYLFNPEFKELSDALVKEMPKVSLKILAWAAVNKPKAAVKILLYRLHLFRILQFSLKGQ